MEYWVFKATKRSRGTLLYRVLVLFFPKIPLFQHSNIPFSNSKPNFQKRENGAGKPANKLPVVFFVVKKPQLPLDGSI
ncbi:MAG: hypothetical protein CVU64_07015 [Deltaproteobacteria bacterium HGW-Deltaproteobacteria-21]|jgi:hypothetical protein|nr:MAG: hypothetical protein CVU64_07015 [Deltaproteobacteria bacterium HGW-Deltaproteobacteria-21]